MKASVIVDHGHGVEVFAGEVECVRIVYKSGDPGTIETVSLDWSEVKSKFVEG